jgi:hypothetical protein
LNSRHYPTPGPTEQHDLLLRFFFGWRDPLLTCVDRAYRDLSRTLRGISRLRDKDSVRDKARKVIRSELESVANLGINQSEYDSWHRETCERLIAVYRESAYPAFSVGHAQKWLNMAVKYIFVWGDEKLPGYLDLYRLAHVPIDSVVIQRFNKFGAPVLSTPWSKLNGYEEYMKYQKWVRVTFRGSEPLAVEFTIWQENDATQEPVGSFLLPLRPQTGFGTQ